MPNGDSLKGTDYSAQGGLIIPVPERKGLYYIVTTDASGLPNGCKTSLVDMSLDNGLGGLVPMG